MNWQTYREMFRTKKIDESHFVLGLDIGNETSALAFFDTNRKTSEQIDISGGYGKPSFPSVLQFLAETNEWVFGEYALQNIATANDSTFVSLLDKQAKGDYVEIGGKMMNMNQILALYVGELLAHCKNLNPKAEIVGIVVAVQNDITEEQTQNIVSVLRGAGYEKTLIALVSQAECILRHYDFYHPLSREKVLLLDFGSRAIRGGIYDVLPKNHQLEINCISYYFDKKLGTKSIHEATTDLFLHDYCEHFHVEKEQLSKQTMDHLRAFSYQQKDVLFQKKALMQTTKLYYNFAYPPFQKVVGKEMVESFLQPFKNEMHAFLNQVFTKTIEKPLSYGEVQTVICTGGGFEMFWARQMVQELFPSSNVVFHKNTKAMAAEGASIAAATTLHLLPQKNLFLTDVHKLNHDIGVCVTKNGKERFVPLVQKNSFWWQEHVPLCFLLDQAQSEDSEQPIEIVFYARDPYDHIKTLATAQIFGLPPRPKGTCRLQISLQCTSHKTFKATICDMGFGELFPATNYQQDFVFSLL